MNTIVCILLIALFTLRACSPHIKKADETAKQSTKQMLFKEELCGMPPGEMPPRSVECLSALKAAIDYIDKLEMENAALRQEYESLRRELTPINQLTTTSPSPYAKRDGFTLKEPSKMLPDPFDCEYQLVAAEDYIDKLEVENRVLRQEVESLGRELASLKQTTTTTLSTETDHAK